MDMKDDYGPKRMIEFAKARESGSVEIYMNYSGTRSCNGSYFKCKDATFDIVDDSFLLWHDGSFLAGNWEDGIFFNGIFDNGQWDNGIWISGLWRSGVWNTGCFYSGCIDYIRWHGGIFYNGIVKGGSFYDGTIKDGRFSNTVARYYGGDEPF